MDSHVRGTNHEDDAEEHFAVDMLKFKKDDANHGEVNDVVLIWDTGAAKHLFEYVLDGVYRVRNRK
jgi:hypothetical protein